ncbi:MULTISPECIES: class I SAM-dependent methyltransferase [Oceanobacillus]|uniref:SAM-dependent methyltransferase n=1 Tax=Oceanobacillus kimchii TaxID=746691 RepID=A0ABQ5TPR3_9BACI|nr:MULTISPECIES: class I SAM-dependent methyltransferase [Oceanobacillus]MBT2598306.1 tRNA (adenine(22)-N(1))-methyltransferase TrmK [Oceanobacillus sp. ISL-74]MBT2651225.1 tRNA (adenine(22)-N(1))-methyltransferase TrmK [Oceanobacillus sp. ISL-73]MCT1575884.1 class I SAM-dependent methyltransferase [Oceanobacillus kimchii]MCT2135521.1 class I SAM-dependent methyltransferase [Oceanobacillus kimchii]OEH55626.1 SAM-dependent methyltransferase [Oceanobacillus sp. E9]
MGKRVSLSNRLKKVASYLPENANFADIGSDHAYLAAYVCQNNPNAKAIAGEVNIGPLESAKDTINEYGLQNQIDVRLGDGLEVIRPGEIKQIVIAGMGGSLITSILNQHKEIALEVDRMVLQPNVDAKELRQWLDDHKYLLIMEEIIEEQGHIYEILVAGKDKSIKSPYNDLEKEKQLYFGPYLLQDRNDAFMKKWQIEREKLERIVKQMKQAKQIDHDKINLFTKELEWMREVLNNEKNNMETR